jgi:hypothetical protein
MMAAIRTLEDMPERYLVADESEELGQEVRLLLYGKRNHKYRVYYSIQYKTTSRGTVRVFHVRHWARKSLNTNQFRELVATRMV